MHTSTTSQFTHKIFLVANNTGAVFWPAVHCIEYEHAHTVHRNVSRFIKTVYVQTALVVIQVQWNSSVQSILYCNGTGTMRGAT